MIRVYVRRTIEAAAAGSGPVHACEWSSVEDVMSERPPTGDLIYDWNTAGNGLSAHRSAPVEFDDRDAA